MEYELNPFEVYDTLSAYEGTELVRDTWANQY
jgi:hypothetical protein